MSAELTFRTAEPSDVPEIVRLVESAYRGEASRAGWTTEADLLAGQRTDPEQVDEMLIAEGSVVFLAERGGTIVACCHLENRDDHVYIGMFAVSPPAQGAGYGRTVLAAAEDFARAEWGANEARMTVIIQRIELIAWYERRGYAKTGHTSPFPYGDDRFGIPQHDDLAFETLVKPLGPRPRSSSGVSGWPTTERE
ncbi:GNAT family N-acetyltransferase [Microbacterium amylolyticum]|uniref:GNAT superfamily N-acetyltransferase n=1 Tax=Microbacterium amylolyticum TaxID=936337 RepID=A0ABS4ZK92_9MICO|nr:GNAT family N-acetyltransferase [Microbacterium amylolyticum]MBP2437712.1 GNAT superfamily N-acetyltransferase [Microbacterium amylolyticum]